MSKYKRFRELDLDLDLDIYTNDLIIVTPTNRFTGTRVYSVMKALSHLLMRFYLKGFVLSLLVFFCALCHVEKFLRSCIYIQSFVAYQQRQKDDDTRSVRHSE